MNSRKDRGPRATGAANERSAMVAGPRRWRRPNASKMAAAGAVCCWPACRVSRLPGPRQPSGTSGTLLRCRIKYDGPGQQWLCRLRRGSA
jgi:hypothetical protein